MDRMNRRGFLKTAGNIVAGATVATNLRAGLSAEPASAATGRAVLPINSLRRMFGTVDATHDDARKPMSLSRFTGAASGCRLRRAAAGSLSILKV